jgi:hypothetical protein
MTLSERLEEDFKQALKARETVKVSALRMLKAALSNAAIRKGKQELDDAEFFEVVASLIRQREESVEAFAKGGRSDLVEKEKQEMEILKAYLPKPMGEDEVQAIIRSVIEELGVHGPAGMGPVMKAVMPKVAGRVDGKKVSQWVRQALGLP